MKQYVTAKEFLEEECSKCNSIGFCKDKQDLNNPVHVHWLFACPKYFKMNLERYKEEMSHVAEDDE